MARIIILCLSVLILSDRRAAAGGDVPDWAVVSAIFVERCVMCHSPLGASLGLRLDTYETTIAGSEKGAVVVAGDPAGSELLRRLRGESVPRMPFLSYPLSDEQIALIALWIEAGLPESNGGATTADRTGTDVPPPH